MPHRLPRSSWTLMIFTAFAAASALRAAPLERQRDLYGDSVPEGALARMGTERLRHPYAVGIAFAADGKTLISAGQDQTVRFWDRATGQLRQLQRVPEKQLVLALSKDSKLLVLQDEEHLILWDVAANKESQRIHTGTQKLSSVVFSPDGKLLAGNREGLIFLWDAHSGKEHARCQHKEEQVGKPVFSSDGKILAASGNQHLVLWDVLSGKELRTITGPNTACFWLTLSTDGKQLAGAGYRTVALWETATGKESIILQFEIAQGSSGHVVAFSPDGQTLAIRRNDHVILWDRATGKETKKLHGPYLTGYDPHAQLRFSSDGKQLASLLSGAILLWDVASGKLVQDKPGHDAWTNSVAFSPDGKLLASASGGDATVRLWDAHTGKQMYVWSLGHGWIGQLMFTADGAHVAATGLGGIIRECHMWDVRTGKDHRIFRLPAETKEQSDQPTALYVSPDGKRLTVLSLWSEGKGRATKWRRYLTTWKVATGEQIERRACAFDSRIQMGLDNFSPDGKLVTTLDPNARGGAFMIYDVVADRPLRSGLPGGFAPPVFSPDGKVIAYGGYSSPTLFSDVASGANLLTLPTGEAVHRTFTHDGRYLFTEADKTLRLWELASGKEVLHRPVDGTSSLTVAPDGRSAATGMADTTILVWDLAPETRQKIKLQPADLDRLWNDLSGEDAPRAYRALGTLLADPQRSVPFLREHLQPIKADAPLIRRLIVDLDSDQFPIRDAAWKELEKMDDAAYGVLRQALKNATSLELRRRIQLLLSDPWVVKAPRKLQQIRAIAVLEQIGTAETRRILEDLASGVAEARQTREAKEVLQRMNKRS